MQVDQQSWGPVDCDLVIILLLLIKECKIPKRELSLLSYHLRSLISVHHIPLLSVLCSECMRKQVWKNWRERSCSYPNTRVEFKPQVTVNSLKIILLSTRTPMKQKVYSVSAIILFVYPWLGITFCNISRM